MATPISTVRKKRGPSRIAVERRRDLIEAAIRDIARNGYATVTVASICAEAGFSRGLIGHYFANKEELLLEAVKTVAVELGSAIRDAANAAKPDPVQMLHALIHASFTPPGLTDEKIAVWVSLASSARWSEQLGGIYREIWIGYRSGVGRLFARAAQARGISINTSHVALAFSQLVEGLWIGLAANRAIVNATDAERCCHHYVDLVLDAKRDAPSAPMPASKAVRKRRAMAD